MAYFSNGSEGEVLNEQCADCPVGRNPDAPCPVRFAQGAYNYAQITNGKRNKIADVLNGLVDEKGICQMRKVMLKYLDRDYRPINQAMILPGMEAWAAKANALCF